MSGHTCQDRGGFCAGCAAEEFDDAVESRTLAHMEAMTVAIAEIAGEIDCEPHKIQELLWDFVEAIVRRRMEES